MHGIGLQSFISVENKFQGVIRCDENTTDFITVQITDAVEFENSLDPVSDS